MNITFKNMGKPYHFGDSGCGGGNFLNLSYSKEPPFFPFNIKSIDLLEDKKTRYQKKFFKTIEINEYNYTIKLGYQIFSNSDDISYININVLPEEIDFAKQVVSFINQLLKNQDDYQKGLYSQNTDSSIEKVKVVDEDGILHELPINLQLSDENLALVVEKGKTYHTHLNCFKEWTSYMQEDFSEWHIITKKEAENRGLKLCSFCKEKDNTSLDDILEEIENEEKEMDLSI